VARKISFGECLERCLDKRQGQLAEIALGACLPKCKKRVRTRDERTAYKMMERRLFYLLSFLVGERQAGLFDGVEATEIPDLDLVRGKKKRNRRKL
jgi:hypothetical protein